MRRTIAAAILFLTILASAAAVYGGEYTDVKQGNWAYEAVNAMSDKTIIKGYPDGSFKPNNTITYGEFIKMALIAGTGKDDGNAASGHWASNYYNKGLELNYFNEYDIHRSQLGDQITRGDMALIISAILGDVEIPNYDKIQKGIEDVTYQTEYEYDIVKSYAAGILTGYTDNTFRPAKTLSRAESAAVIHRLVDESKRVLPEVAPEAATGAAVTYPTSELLDLSKLTPEKTVAVSVHFTDRYELYTDASEFGIKMYRAWDGTGCAFDHTLRGHIYLIKNREIVEYCNTTPKYDTNGNYLNYQRSISHYDISKADYIVAVPTNAETDNRIIEAVINPFKQ